jgi:hypothetical protein
MNKNILDLEWNHLCLNGCYTPLDHCHHFTIGRTINKVCSGCQNEMKPDAQTYGNRFGQNKAELINRYKCKKCNKENSIIVYEGIPRSYKDFAASAKRVVSYLWN